MVPRMRFRLFSGWFGGLWGVFGLPAAHLPPIIQGPDGAEMVLVPAGPFIQGTHWGAPEEGPPHQRELPAFYVDRTEVTVVQYARFLAATGHPAPPGWINGQLPSGSERRPVTNIRWTDALRYALWAGKRLPTEAEWEKAARGTDGRRFPWGMADDPERRNLNTGKLRPVGAYPGGASACGALDLSGNAWEWTADWFEPYPGASGSSPHFGRHYKVVRGGGGEYLYGTANAGTTTQRARLAPYGAHDFVGFRCVMDPPGRPPAQDAKALLREAEERLAAALPPPRERAYERAFAALKRAGRIPLQVQGAPGQRGMVIAGFPLPRQRAQDPGVLRVVDVERRPRPRAVEPLSRWADGSLRWVLLRFPARSGETVEVVLDEPMAPAVFRPPLQVTSEGEELRLDTGPLQIELNRVGGLRSIRHQGREVCGGMELWMRLREDPGNGPFQELRAGPASGLEILSQSELHAEVRWRGPLMDAEGRDGPLTCDWRLRAEAGSAQLRVWLTVLHAAPRQPPWEELKPRVAVADWRVGLVLAGPASRWLLGRESGAWEVPGEPPVELLQPDDLQYRLKAGGRELAAGTRAPGWLAARCEGGWVSLGVRDFWQTHPKALSADTRTLAAGLWAGTEPFLWEGGLALTHELVITIGADAAEPPAFTPLRAVSPPAWVCGAEAVGPLIPRDGEALRQLGYWEAWRETDQRRWVNAMPTGLRDYGDAYLGGPYKGRHAFLNLEYDVPFNFLLQYLRTGQGWYFEAAEAMVRHQADVDVEHVTGFAWKHSPLHTTTEAEFGHVFVRGLLLHHLLSGDPRSREVAERLGDWIATALVRGQGIGNERQIGWSLYALTALYEVTGEARYLEAARALTDRLAREQSPTGQFALRWDNRIAFFNGIAAHGILSVHEAAPDPALARAVLRLAERTLGMYPDYAARTLNAWGWILERTGDPRFLHQIELTWLSTLEFLLDRDTTATETHAWRFPRLAARHDLMPALPDEPEVLPEAASWRPLRFKSRAVELFLKPRVAAPVPVVIAREGPASGVAELFDASGVRLVEVRLAEATRPVQCARIELPARPPWLRLRLAGPEVFGWQVQHDRRLAVVVADPRGEQLPFLLPRAFGRLADGALEVTLRFEAQGEGYHAATLHDPAGVPVRRVRRFVEFEDPGRYELELKAAVNGPRAGWSLELNAVKVLRAEGFLPYWSASAEDWFHPEQP